MQLGKIGITALITLFAAGTTAFIPKISYSVSVDSAHPTVIDNDAKCQLEPYRVLR